jgi:hypothetical protein
VTLPLLSKPKFTQPQLLLQIQNTLSRCSMKGGWCDEICLRITGFVFFLFGLVVVPPFSPPFCERWVPVVVGSPPAAWPSFRRGLFVSGRDLFLLVLFCVILVVSLWFGSVCLQSPFRSVSGKVCVFVPGVLWFCSVELLAAGWSVFVDYAKP